VLGNRNFWWLLILATAAAAPAGCGTDEANNETSSGSAVSADVRRDCGDERVLKLTPGSRLQWAVTKNADIPVAGEHQVSGQLAFASAEFFARPQLNLSFNEEDLDSGEALRDARLRDYVFGIPEGLHAKFVLTKASLAETTAFPAVGAALALVIFGDLTIADKTTALEIPARLTATANGFLVEQTDVVVLNLREQLQLGDRLAALLALVEATMKDEIEIKFNLELQDICR